MAVGAQNNLGGHQTFARKMTWCIAFLCQNWDGFFLPKLRCPPKKKKVFTEILTVFLSKLRCSPINKKKKKKGLHWNCDGLLPMVCVNKQNICPNKYIICPNFRRFEPNGGATAPTCPPASYGYACMKSTAKILVDERQCEHDCLWSRRNIGYWCKKSCRRFDPHVLDGIVSSKEIAKSTVLCNIIT